MQKTTLGSLINRFRFERQQATDKSKRLLWDRNKVPIQKRDDYELRVDTRKTRDGGETIHVELWKKIDQETVQLEIDAKVVPVDNPVEKKSDDIGSLLSE